LTFIPCLLLCNDQRALPAALINIYCGPVLVSFIVSLFLLCLFVYHVSQNSIGLRVCCMVGSHVSLIKRAALALMFQNSLLVLTIFFSAANINAMGLMSS